MSRRPRRGTGLGPAETTPRRPATVSFLGVLVVVLALAGLGDRDLAAEAAADAPGDPAGATTLRSLFEEGTTAAIQGDLSAASRSFDRLVDVGVEDPDVFYDRALVHAQQGRFGEAIRDFRAVLDLRPGDAQARRGLRWSQEALAERRAEVEGEATVTGRSTPFASLVGFLDEPRAAIAVVVFEVLLLIALGVAISVRREAVRVSAVLASLTFAILLGVSGVVLGARRGFFTDGQPAVAIDDSVLLAGPVVGATSRGEVLEGTPVVVLDERGGHYQVRVGSLEGWLPAERVGVVGE